GFGAEFGGQSPGRANFDDRLDHLAHGLPAAARGVQNSTLRGWRMRRPLEQLDAIVDVNEVARLRAGSDSRPLAAQATIHDVRHEPARIFPRPVCRKDANRGYRSPAVSGGLAE